MKRYLVRTVPTAVAALANGCIDFGYRVPPPEPADAPAADEGAGNCVEQMVAPSAGGPRVSFITLNVDTPQLEITAGDVVTWTNTDTMTHTVTAGAPGAPLPPSKGGFDSGDIAPSAQWAYKFCTPRTAIYFCKTHAGQMNNYRVVVRAAAAREPER